MKVHDMIDLVVSQIDEVTARNYPGSPKYPNQAGALKGALWGALQRLSEKDRADWFREQTLIYTMHMEKPV